jgi:serine/threonine-protein kinase
VLKDRYVVERELGKGGMGLVYLGRDRVLQRPVAVKVIRPLDPELRNRTVCEAGLRESFVEEARLGANLTHPALATVFDFGFHEGEPFTVFEYIPGKTLRDVLRQRGRLPLEEAQLILGPLAQALDFAHSRQVVHRDLKPDNVRATDQGHFKILDLGLAKEFRHHVDWRFAGTPAYASPEQANNLPCDGRTDQYALAVIVYEMLTGFRPFHHKDVWELLRMHGDREPPSPLTLLPDLPPFVADAILRALRKDPNERFPTCQEFAVAAGCQLLNAPVPAPEILRLTVLLRLFGNRRSSFLPLTRWGTALYLALTGDALWCSYRGEMFRWPLEAVRDVERNWWGSKLQLLIRTPKGILRQGFQFLSSEECQEWFEKIQALREGFSGTSAAPLDGGRVEPVVLLRQRSIMRYQSLGAVEFKDGKRKRAEVGLRIRAALMGADAVVDVRRERLPEFGRTVHRLSGTAVRAVDLVGRLELGARWFASQVNWISFWMLVVVAVSYGGMLLGAFLYADQWITDINNPLSHDLAAAERHGVRVFLLVSIIHIWPLTISLLLRILQWPQLLCPAAIAVVSLGATPVVSLLGWLLATYQTGKWPGLVVYARVLLDPFNLMLVVFCVFLGRRAWRVYREYGRLAREARVATPLTRKVTEVIALGASVLFLLLLMGVQPWSGYSSSVVERIVISDPQTSTKTEAAQQLFSAGAAVAATDPRQAERSYLGAAILWQELVIEHPQTPAFRQNLAVTYNNLGELKVQAGQLEEAERYYLQSLAIAERLAAEFPSQAGYQQDVERTQKNLKALDAIKPARDIKP